VKSSQHLVARGPRRETFEFSQEVVGERLFSLRCNASGTFRI
jgi:hypothetical protein